MRRRKHPNDRRKAGCSGIWCFTHRNTPHRGRWSGVKIERKLMERSARARCRDALKQGLEPEPYRTRSSAKWELF